jgi:hypothetical protein
VTNNPLLRMIANVPQLLIILATAVTFSQLGSMVAYEVGCLSERS